MVRWTRSTTDPCVYTYNADDPKGFLAICIWVDDILSIESNPDIRNNFIEALGKKFKIVDQGEANWMLGTEIKQTTMSVALNQEKYLNDILTQFGMEECKAALTPGVLKKEPTMRKTLMKTLNNT